MAGAETKFDLDNILRQLGRSFLTASKDLRKEFDKEDWADVPYIYHLPKMRVSMQVALSYSDGKVHGNFITGKRTKTEEAELVTTIDVDLVSVPREVEGPTTPEKREVEPSPEPGETPTEPSEDETEGKAQEGNGGKAESRPIPTTVTLPPARPILPGGVRRGLEKLGFTDIDNPKSRGGGRFDVKAKWRGERKKLRIDTRTGSISESK